jgi:hypothetical protein
LVTDYSEHGAVPTDDSATDDPPTVDEVIERQLVEHPEQARTSTMQADISEDERATIDAGGEPVATTADGVEVEGPNSS